VFIENRDRKRFCPEGVTACIVINFEQGNEIQMDGEVVDMSYGGIKIKLRHPFSHLVEEAAINIRIVLPESKVPVSIHGKIKHLGSADQCGLQYASQHSESELDDLMFECVKYAPQYKEESLEI